MKVVFLDFDGTMIPTSFSKFMEQMNKLSSNGLSNNLYGEYFAPYCVENLLLLLKSKEAKIVFTTNWRDKGNNFLVDMFVNRYNIPKELILGSTEIIDSKKRGLEIKSFIDSNKSITNYVILDDMGPSFFLEEQIDKLVECDPMFGFTSNDLKRAMKAL